MKEILEISCADLTRRIALAEEALASKKFPRQLQLCIDWVESSFRRIKEDVAEITRLAGRNLRDKDIELALFNEITNIHNEIDVIDSNIIHALYRANANDIVALKTIEWLHVNHSQTQNKAFLVSNGVFSIAPSHNYPTLYWLPLTSQLSILQLPLFFHEFGHQLFSVHAPEMMDLIRSFQGKLKEFLTPAISQNDEKHKSYLEKAQEIIETWREWMEELFADAVGLQIGGKSYLLAFSYYMRLNGRSEFFLPEKMLIRSSHPVTSLRVKFLIQRAKELGLEKEATLVESDWEKLRSVMNVSEDYFGYYRKEYHSYIWETIENMLVETEPINFSMIPDNVINYPEVFTKAWEEFLFRPTSYGAWEKNELINLGSI